MAQVKKMVASDMKRGRSMKTIVNDAVENKNLSKMDVVKAVLWFAWFKTAKFLRLGKIAHVLGIITWVITVVLILLLALVVLGAFALLSPLWYPILMWLAPKSAMRLINYDVDDDNKKGWWESIKYACLVGYYLIAGAMMFCWKRVWQHMPMKQRQHFIDETGIELKTLKVKEQLSYYRLNATSETIRKMSWEAVEELRLNYKDVADLKNIGDVYEIYEALGKELFTGFYASFNLLKGYCANEKKNVVSSLIWYFAEQLIKGDDEVTRERALEIMKVCCENRTLEDTLLKMLAAALGSDEPAGSNVEVLLNTYFGRRSFSRNVIQQIVMFATERVADTCRERNYKLLVKIARREGLTIEETETFFERCDDAQNKEMTEVLKMWMDLETVANNRETDENRAKWLQFCKLREYLSPEAQLRMTEWQYVIFHECGLKLDKQVIYEFLIKKFSESDKSYFERVLAEEEERDTLSETSQKLIMMIPWKREIIFDKVTADDRYETAKL